MSPEDLQPAMEAFERARAGFEKLMRDALGPFDMGDLCGQRIGNYKLLQKIGEGGFGDVYMAEQAEPRREVAVKIIRAGVESKEVIARFEQERNILAAMEHPHIAQIFDAGITASGRPFFVMELVNGLPITRYCDGERLSIPQRLELFAMVCTAVEHLHERGIIHRDIKPSNVLVSTVDGQALPKLIDFGIARAITQPMTAKTLFTRFGQMIGTPAYSSPEQISGARDISTKTDVYSLGALLYELLAGAPAFNPRELRERAHDEIVRMIREVEPPTPSKRLSQLGPQLAGVAHNRQTDPPRLGLVVRGELDWIVMKCLAKECPRRYPSAMEIAKDVRRHLRGEPVVAAPDSRMYRLRKSVRKHRWAVTTVSLVALSLVLGIVVSSAQWIRANAAAQRAFQAATIARHAEHRADERADEAERQSYLAGVLSARVCLKEGQLQLARDWLDACPQQWRHWEWGLLRSLCDGSSHIVLRHDEDRDSRSITEIVSAAVSPDGTRVVTAAWHLDHCPNTDDRSPRRGTSCSSVYVWDASTGHKLSELRGHEGQVLSTTFSPDGRRILTASEDTTARVWDVATAMPMHVLQHEGPMTSASFSRDGTRVVTTGCSEVRVWDAESGAELTVLRGHQAYYMKAALSPDGALVVAGSRLPIVYDASTGTRLFSLRGPVGSIESLCFSPDGTQIATVIGDVVHISDASDGSQTNELVHSDHVHSAAFSPDGAQMITGCTDGIARLWGLTGQKKPRRLLRHDDAVLYAIFSADGSRIVTASQDATARVWDGYGSSLYVFMHERLEPGPDAWSGTRMNGSPYTLLLPPVRYAAADSSGSRVLTLTRGGGTAHVWAAATSLEPQVLSARFAVFSPDGTRIVVLRDRKAQVVDTVTGTCIASLGSDGDLLTPAAMSPDNRRIVAVSSVKTARVWDVATGAELITLHGHTDRVRSVVFSPDGARILSASSDQTARLWDAATGREVRALRGHEGPVHSAAFSPDSTRVVTASDDRTCRVWSAASGEELRAFRGHKKPVRAAAFGPDGIRVVTASTDATARIWNLVSGDQLLELRGWAPGFQCAAFSPDGMRVVTASAYGSIQVWDAPSGTELLAITGLLQPLRDVAFSPDGACIVANSYSLVQFWDPTRCLSLPDTSAMGPHLLPRRRVGRLGGEH